MKTGKIFILSAIIFTAMAAYQCSSGSAENSDSAKMIVKKWQWESMSSKAMDDQMAALRTQADTTKDSTSKAMLMQSIKGTEAMMEALKSTTMEFKADGSSETSMSMMGQADVRKGKWSLSTDGKKLITSETKAEGGEKTDTISIKDISDEKLTLVTSDGKGDVTITMKAIK